MSDPSGGGYDAVVLAGGTSRRMGGGDKTSLDVGGLALLDRALSALADASRIVVVGTPRPTVRSVRWTLEDPPGGGPAAALAAGLTDVTASIVVALAADLPLITPATIGRIVAAAQPSGAVLVDAGGAPQWLLGAWPIEVLRTALSGDQAGRSLRAALAPLAPACVTSEDGSPEWFDCDRPSDLDTAKELLDERAGRLAR